MKKILASIVFVASLLLLMIPEAEGGDCVIRPRYVTPATYVSPQTYYNEKVILVPQPIVVERNRDHYYSIDGAYQQSLLADAIVGRLLLAQGKTLPVDQKPNPSQLERAKPQGVRGASPNQDAKFLAVVNASCIKCHGVGDKYPLVNAEGQILDFSEEYSWKIFGKVSTGEMPKTLAALGDADTKLFYDFVVAQKGRK